MDTFDERMALEEMSDYTAEQLDLEQERFEAWVQMMEDDYGTEYPESDQAG